MIPREFVTIAFGNLWRMKLRSALTIAGVVIGIGALVSMFSFAFGVQKNVSAEFEKIGLMRTLQVMPRAAEGNSTGGEIAPLDATVLERIEKIPGVSFVYPQQAFDAKVRWPNHTVEAGVQALPAGFIEKRHLGKMLAGRFFAADSAAEAVVSQAWVRDRHLDADSLLGQTLTLSGAGVPEMGLALGGRWLTGTGVPAWVANEIVRWGEIILGLFRPGPIEVRVVGIAEVDWGFGFQLGDILVPPGVLAGHDFLSFNDPLELMAMVESPASSGWPMLIVTVESERVRDRVQKDVEAMGFRAFNFVERLVDMRRGFLVMDAIAAVIGFIAIFVAALGIINTLVMSIVERTREIGILKSLGAEDPHIRLLFLTESAVIGAVGSLGGLALGWAVSRAASLVIQKWMLHQQVPPVDLFYLPAWVAAAAVLFGILVSVLAGLYPSGRAARVDPVLALRHD